MDQQQQTNTGQPQQTANIDMTKQVGEDAGTGQPQQTASGEAAKQADGTGGATIGEDAGGTGQLQQA